MSAIHNSVTERSAESDIRRDSDQTGSGDTNALFIIYSKNVYGIFLLFVEVKRACTLFNRGAWLTDESGH